MAGRLAVISGCMFSGKTQELLRRIDRAEIAGKEVVLIKPYLDDRYAKEKVVAHSGREQKARLLKSGRENLAELKEILNEEELKVADIVAFDEGNFFGEDLFDLVLKLIGQGKRVIVAGLNLTFAGEPFKPMPRLMVESDKLDLLHAVCTECGNAATRTQRLLDGEPAPSDDDVIKVGGKGDYEARCRDCWELG
jgi:thymidine kinase